MNHSGNDFHLRCYDIEHKLGTDLSPEARLRQVADAYRACYIDAAAQLTALTTEPKLPADEHRFYVTVPIFGEVAADVTGDGDGSYYITSIWFKGADVAEVVDQDSVYPQIEKQMADEAA